jgi:alkylation response protein AidB-like acyl-CoA dehydrogenase
MYTAPIRDLLFVMHQQFKVQQLSASARFADYSPDLAESILTEAGKFASEILDPLNRTGDEHGATWSSDGVKAAPGFRAAYQRYVADGWPQLGISAEHGGQGAPLTLNTAVEEICFGANLALMLCPTLGHGAVEALKIAGSDALKARFLPKMVSGEWTGTMNLTESQAGSDLAAIRTRAVASGDHYLIQGQKIFISWGDHDVADNIVHLVLARIEGAPAGVKGISLFVVPKFLDAGRNDVRCVSIEHKLGIHASPTCVMAYGDTQGAVGYLVGEANRGLEYMFIMMNAARLSVGVQGVGQSERALQQARTWVLSRVQGRAVGGPQAAGSPATIIQHPDVRRMMLTIKSGVEAMRALYVYSALQSDLARANGDAVAQARAELLIPVVKGWCTEQSNEMASLAMQIHGGMGYIEETGVAQTLRDARITAIYEGTTGIQANDLLGRKLLRDSGAALRELLATLRAMLAAAATAAARGNAAQLAAAHEAAAASLLLLGDVSEALLQIANRNPSEAYAVSVPFLKLCGLSFSSVLLIHGALVAASADAGVDDAFAQGKLQLASFACNHTLPQAQALAETIRVGGSSVTGVDPATV